MEMNNNNHFVFARLEESVFDVFVDDFHGIVFARSIFETISMCF